MVSEFNPYEWLDLDPNEADWDKIESKFARFTKEVNELRINCPPSRKDEARQRNDVLPKLKAFLDNRDEPGRLRYAREWKQEIDRRKRQKMQDLEELLQGRSTISLEKKKYLVREFGSVLSDSDVDDAIARLGVEVSDAASPGSSFRMLPLERWDSIQRALDRIDAADLYEFLESETTNRVVTRESPASDLYQVAGEAAALYRKLAQRSEGRTDAERRRDVAARCLEVFKDEAVKTQYDQGLRLKPMHKFRGHLELDVDNSVWQVSRILRRAVDSGIDDKLAREWIEEVARQKDWTVMPDRERRGFRFVGKDYLSAADLAAGFAAHWQDARRIWRDKRPELLNDFVVDHLGKPELRGQLEDIANGDLTLNAQVFLMIRRLDRRQQSFLGVELIADQLAKLADQAAKQPDGPGGRVLRGLHSSGILSVAHQYGPPLPLENATEVARSWTDSIKAYESLFKTHRNRNLPLDNRRRTLVIAASTPGSAVKEGLRKWAREVLNRHPLAVECVWFPYRDSVEEAGGPALLAMIHLAEQAHAEVEESGRTAGRGTSRGASARAARRRTRARRLVRRSAVRAGLVPVMVVGILLLTFVEVVVRGPAKDSGFRDGYSGTEEEQRQLGLNPDAWRRIQANFAEQGFLEQTHVDGIFGPRTREAIAEWQSASGHQATGYLTASAVQLLMQPVGEVAGSPAKEVPAPPTSPGPNQPEERMAVDQESEGDQMARRLSQHLGRPLSPTARGRYGLTDLHYAAALNLPELARNLLEDGADVNVWHDHVKLSDDLENGDSSVTGVVADLTVTELPCWWIQTEKYGPSRLVTPLHVAASFDAFAVVGVLLDHGADIDARTGTTGDDGYEEYQGSTPLHLAAEEGAQRALRRLLDRGASVDAGANSWTPLHDASYAGESSPVSSLLRAGADVNARTADGSSPLHLAAFASWAIGAETIAVLLDAGATVDNRSNSGLTPLHAVLRGPSSHCGAPHDHDSDSRPGTPGEGMAEALALLVNRGADIDARDAEGNTALLHLLMSTQGSSRLVSATALLELGADANATNRAGQTPLDLVDEDELRALLRGFGALANEEDVSAADDVPVVATTAMRRLAVLLEQATAGDASAQLDVARMYLEGGDGVDRNYPEAIRWLRAAENNGQSEAAMHLALMYAAGEGVPRNRDQALAWFREFLDAPGQGGAPNAAEPYESLAADAAEAYMQLAHEYLRHFIVREMEPTGVVRLVVADPGPSPDLQANFIRNDFTTRANSIRNDFTTRANFIRNVDRPDDWSLSASARLALDGGAAAQRQRGTNTGRDMSDYLVDEMRGTVRREREAQHGSMYQVTRQTIVNERDRFMDIIDNPSAYVGAIKIDATPRDATVFIDGARYGTVDDMNDGHGWPFLAGQRTIRVSREGYQPHEEVKDLRPRERYVLSGSLERLPGGGDGRNQREEE